MSLSRIKDARKKLFRHFGGIARAIFVRLPRVPRCMLRQARHADNANWRTSGAIQQQLADVQPAGLRRLSGCDPRARASKFVGVMEA